MTNTTKTIIGRVEDTRAHKAWTIWSYGDLPASQIRIIGKEVGEYLRQNHSLYDGPSHDVTIVARKNGFSFQADVGWHWDWSGKEVMGELEWLPPARG